MLAKIHKLCFCEVFHLRDNNIFFLIVKLNRQVLLRELHEASSRYNASIRKWFSKENYLRSDK